ncbi:unnamed protein product [Didymodactylos carnosus]|uniref:Uncharacterized protein n=1 Tax=Didymodactylos carnosus TaxID=1234261 RepID=A0A814PME6_9BILA|nr:unnamed protein product [Didymodactylos carnosus]CAF1554641.1 unnamed protein product [Didymodactylos carnosus]CAF3872517.1 unnamed protein product [Didymodactylos carnosus]CAF4345371.1 unnamed protein product [Didymodactylos carnosus]
MNHISFLEDCEFRHLKYNNKICQGWLFNDLHSAYEGIMEELLAFGLDAKYRAEPWSVRHQIDELQRILDDLRLLYITSRHS